MALRTFLRWFVRSPFLLPQQRSTIVVGLSKMIFCCWTGVPHQAIPSGNMSEYTTEGTEGAKKQQKEGAKQKYDQQREREGSHTRIGDDGMAWQGTGNGGRTGTRCGWYCRWNEPNEWVSVPSFENVLALCLCYNAIYTHFAATLSLMTGWSRSFLFSLSRFRRRRRCVVFVVAVVVVVVICAFTLPLLYCYSSGT